jgi:hypothetical protein
MIRTASVVPGRPGVGHHDAILIHITRGISSWTILQTTRIVSGFTRRVAVPIGMLRLDGVPD